MEDNSLPVPPAVSYTDCTVQTRSEETGLGTFYSLEGALDHAKKDPTIWKISFSFGKERVILEKTFDNHWVLRG
jgi:hypothetical protein